MLYNAVVFPRSVYFLFIYLMEVYFIPPLKHTDVMSLLFSAKGIPTLNLISLHIKMGRQPVRAASPPHVLFLLTGVFLCGYRNTDMLISLCRDESSLPVTEL